jgi:hypothetical protein
VRQLHSPLGLRVISATPRPWVCSIASSFSLGLSTHPHSPLSVRAAGLSPRTCSRRVVGNLGADSGPHAVFALVPPCVSFASPKFAAEDVERFPCDVIDIGGGGSSCLMDGRTCTYQLASFGFLPSYSHPFSFGRQSACAGLED